MRAMRRVRDVLTFLPYKQAASMEIAMNDWQRTNLTKGIVQSKALIKTLESSMEPAGATLDSLDREKQRLAYLEARLVRFGA
jgi:hypothetical protein